MAVDLSAQTLNDIVATDASPVKTRGRREATEKVKRQIREHYILRICGFRVLYLVYALWKVDFFTSLGRRFRFGQNDERN